MNCRKARQWISLERDGQLEHRHVSALQGHLAGCQDCQEYRRDLDLGLRMLAATEPELPETFDWKLQLRLNQTLREAAGARSYPWDEREAGWRSWLGRAGLSAALGLAAVLAVAMLAPNQLAPVLGGDGATVASAPQNARLPLQVSSPAEPLFDATRRPITPGLGQLGDLGDRLQRRVSSNGLNSAGLAERGLGAGYWSGANERDLLRIHQLEQDLETLRRRLAAKDRTITLLRAELDSLKTRAVDTRREAAGAN